MFIVVHVNLCAAVCLYDKDAVSFYWSIIFHSGTKLEGDHYVTNGGRVLGVVGLGKDLRTALDRAYERVDHITFKGMQYRKDIGAKAFK